MIKINKKELFVYSVISFFILIYLQFNTEINRPHFDSLKYIDYAINIHQTGYFGLPQEGQGPSNQNMPLYPYFVSIIMKLSPDIESNILCLADDISYSNCSLNGIKKLFLIQAIFMLIPLICVWLISNILITSKLTAWLSGAFCLASGRLINFSSIIMTEAILIPFFSIFLVTFLLSIKFHQFKWHLTSAIILGLITLTRPEYIYLFYFYVTIQLFFYIYKKKINLLKLLLVLTFGYYSVVGPWMARNAYHFNTTNLTSSYASVTLIQRVSYNRMSWQEWGTAFIYWFPDMGDSIAKRLFPESNYKRLTYDADSFYVDSGKIVENNKELNGDYSTSNLLKVEIFGNFIKHTLVTIPLFWKGMFVAKLWGVLALACYVFLCFKKRNEDYIFFLILLRIPLWFMVGLHAFVSINIPRYNIFLVPYLSVFLAISFTQLFNFFQFKFFRQN